MDTVKQLTPFLAVAGQMQPQDMATIAKTGFLTVINNRPDGESDEQPSSAQIAQAAHAAGLHYHYLPIVAGQISDQNATDFAQLLTEVKGPVLAFCRTGTRSTSVWALTEAHHLDPVAILAAAKGAGYDLTSLEPRLQERWLA